MEIRFLDLGGMTARELITRVWAEIRKDKIWEAAAGLAYFFLLALFPLLIFIISLISIAGMTTVVEVALRGIRDVAPAAAFELITGQVERVMSRPREGLLTFAALGTLWAASSGVVSLIGMLNRAYDVAEERGYLRRRAVAILMTLALAVLVVAGAVLLMIGDQLASWVAELSGLGWLSGAGAMVYYLLGFGLILFGLEMIYYLGPNRPTRKWNWVSLGSLSAVALFVLSSFGFSLYLRFGGSHEAIYGSIGAVIILMLWLYMLGISIAVGAEVNSVVEGARAAHRRSAAARLLEGA